ncbi:fimbrial protein [Caballeronia telluris]|nr:fimbrial protein [Caballeronia telluris]
MDCNFNGYAPLTNTGVLISIFKAGTPVAGMTDVYPTNISGLGVRYTVTANQCNEKTVIVTNGTGTLHCTMNGAQGVDLPIPATVTTQLVVTGAVTAGVLALTSIPKLNVDYQTSVEPGNTWSQTPVYSGTATGTIRQQSCSVVNSAQAITLPTVTTRSLAGSAGTVAGSKEFSVDLSCAAGAQVSITFTDATNPANTSTVLGLAAGSTATGVGIELRRVNDAKVAYGPDSAAPGTTSQWLVGAAPNGALSIPLSARYVRTTGTLASGLVKALATFTMSYN